MDTVVYVAIERYRRVRRNEDRLEASKKDLDAILKELTPDQVNEYAARTMEDDK